jgi:hypothetical protein
MTILSKLSLSLVAAGIIASAVPAQAVEPLSAMSHTNSVAYGEGWQRGGSQPSWNGRGDDRYDQRDDGARWGRGYQRQQGHDRGDDRAYDREYDSSYDRADWRGDRRDGWRENGRDNGRYERGREVSYQNAAWQGRDGRYYCRKPDGTTGLLVGGAAGALIGRGIAGPYGDRTLGAILGAAGGALLGRAIDRDSARCR